MRTGIKLIDDLKDLHKQATEERSHHYTGCLISEAIAEIERCHYLIHALQSAVVHTVGGSVEGKPTSTTNYLQRLRELVRIESDKTAMLDALKAVVGFWHSYPGTEPNSHITEKVHAAIDGHEVTRTPL